MIEKRQQMLKDISRDLMALGSIPFLLLVLIRIWIADNYMQFSQIIIGAVLIFAVSLVFKKNDNYSALIIVLSVFTSIFYNEMEFTIFAGIVGLISLVGMYYLGRKNVLYGIIAGTISSIISYVISGYLPFGNY